MEEICKTYKEKSVFESVKLYAREKHLCDLEAILLSEDDQYHYTVVVHAMSLLEFSIDFAHFLFKRSEFALKILKGAFYRTALDIYNVHESNTKMMMKENIHIRLTALPSCPEIYRTVLPKCTEVGQFMCITGTIIRATAPKMLEFRKLWSCSKCKYKFTVDVEIEQGFAAVKPLVCASPDPCYSKNFTVISKEVNASWCRDYQEVKIQEQVHNLVVGTVPRSMWVVLENDLVDTCQPGNEVSISGVLYTRWEPLVPGRRMDIELVLLAHNVEVKNINLMQGSVSEEYLNEFKEFWLKYQRNPLEGRNFILTCLCPQVFGLYIIKLAVALVLAGGVQRIDGTTKIRGDSHLLLVGDPGTGKSQFLKYASKISRRAVLTSGVGTTSAGLTVAAVKDGGKWQLEAGALVLADGGICCIDEFSSIKEHDKASIHEAMEQQTISVAKAGLVCKLSTQCSILAATNPKGKYNQHESLSANTALASPLLSRFDIILILLDAYNEEWDNMVASYILEGKDVTLEHSIESAWSMDKMRAYFSAIKNIKPKLTHDCDNQQRQSLEKKQKLHFQCDTGVLQAYYKKQRSYEDRSAARTTPRLLQSLIRLAEGHARIMFRRDVLVVDAIAAITIMESSMLGCPLVESSNALHTTFPDDPQAEYIEQATAILKNLDLDDLLENELSYEGNRESFRENALNEIIKSQMVLPFNLINNDNLTVEKVSSIPCQVNDGSSVLEVPRIAKEEEQDFFKDKSQANYIPVKELLRNINDFTDNKFTSIKKPFENKNCSEVPMKNREKNYEVSTQQVSIKLGEISEKSCRNMFAIPEFNPNVSSIEETPPNVNHEGSLEEINSVKKISMEKLIEYRFTSDRDKGSGCSKTMTINQRNSCSPREIKQNKKRKKYTADNSFDLDLLNSDEIEMQQPSVASITINDQTNVFPTTASVSKTSERSFTKVLDVSTHQKKQEALPETCKSETSNYFTKKTEMSNQMHKRNYVPTTSDSTAEKNKKSDGLAKYHLSDDLSTISEVNAIFSADISFDLNDVDPFASDLDKSNTSAKTNLQKFAYREKGPSKELNNNKKVTSKKVGECSKYQGYHSANVTEQVPADLKLKSSISWMQSQPKSQAMKKIFSSKINDSDCLDFDFL